jgi:hypothetical protein
VRRLLVLPLLLGCRGVEPRQPPVTVVTTEPASTPAAPAADTEDEGLRRRPAAEPELVVRRAWEPEPGDRQSAWRKLARCCAELEKLADTTTSDERKGLILSALDCNAMRDDRTTDPRESLGKLRVGLEGGPVPAACK